MNDDQQEESVRTAFEELHLRVIAAVDLDASHEEFRRRCNHDGAPRRRGKRLVAVAAIIAAGAVATVSMWPNDSATNVIADGSTAAEPRTTESQTCRPAGALAVAMEPKASSTEISDVSAYLGNMTGVADIDFVERAAAYEEFKRMFADHQDLLDSVDSADLPALFWATHNQAWDDSAVADIKQLEGVLIATVTTTGTEGDCHQDGDATLGQGSSAVVPGKGIVDQPLGPMRPVPAFQVSDDQRREAGFGTRSVAVGSADPTDKGYIDWADMYPTTAPADDTFPPPMVPIWNNSRDQIAWWAVQLGWVSFEEVSSPDFDFLERWKQEEALAQEAADRLGRGDLEERSGG